MCAVVSFDGLFRSLRLLLEKSKNVIINHDVTMTSYMYVSIERWEHFVRWGRRRVRSMFDSWQRRWRVKEDQYQREEPESWDYVLQVEIKFGPADMRLDLRQFRNQNNLSLRLRHRWNVWRPSQRQSEMRNRNCIRSRVLQTQGRTLHSRILLNWTINSTITI